MSYADWPIEEFQPHELTLDDKNPRISKAGAPQTAIREALLATADLQKMAESIARTEDVFPHDIPIVVRENRKLVVLEGNRRVATIQMLLDPTLVPPHFASTWPTLTETARENLNSLRVILAPSRKKAEPLIAKTHAFQARMKWKALARMRYAYMAAQNATSLATIANEFGVAESVIQRDIRRYKIYLYVLGLKGWSDEEHAILGREGAPITVLVYPFENESIRALVGTTFDADGAMVSKVARSVVDASLKKLAAHALIPLVPSNHYRLTTRGGDWGSLEKYFVEEHSAWCEAADKAAGKKKEAPSVAKAKAKKTKAPTKGTKSPKRVEFFEDFQIPQTASHRLTNIAAEIVKMRPAYTPLASALVMRMLLEQTLVDHVKRLAKWREYKAQSKDSGGLTSLCKFCTTSSGIFTDTGIKEGLKRFMNNQQGVTLLNLVAHSEWGNVNEPLVLMLKSYVRPIIEKIILEEWT